MKKAKSNETQNTEQIKKIAYESLTVEQTKQSL